MGKEYLYFVLAMAGLVIVTLCVALCFYQYKLRKCKTPLIRCINENIEIKGKLPEAELPHFIGRDELTAEEFTSIIQNMLKRLMFVGLSILALIIPTYAHEDESDSKVIKQKEESHMAREEMMNEAIQLSEENVANGGGSLGAVIERDGKVIAVGVNRVTTNHDPIAHAEVSASRVACEKLGTFDLSGCEIYNRANHAPCALEPSTEFISTECTMAMTKLMPRASAPMIPLSMMKIAFSRRRESCRQEGYSKTERSKLSICG